MPYMSSLLPPRTPTVLVLIRPPPTSGRQATLVAACGTLTEISWLRGVRERKSLVCKPTLQKVSTTFWALSLVLLRLRRPVASGSVGAVGSATASPVFPVSADVPAQVECSAAAPVP